MPRYYFDIKDGHRLVDPSGIECDDDEDAYEKAKAFAIKVAVDKPDDDPERHIAVLNAEGDEVFRVPVYVRPFASSFVRRKAAS